MASVKYDQEANALYVKIENKKRIAETISLGEDRFVDVDENGHVVGFEILFPKSMPKEDIDAIIRSKNELEVIQ